MPVFDFSSIPENEKKQDPVCTYTTVSYTHLTLPTNSRV